MDHLQKAKFAIDRAETVDRHERAVLKTQMAISHALIAIAEKLDRMLDTYDYEQDHK